MKSRSGQLDLFDTGPGPDAAAAATARTWMRSTIDHLRATSGDPGWKDQMAVILQDGAFQRAMALVPADEAQALCAEYDGHMRRLYAIWATARGLPPDTVD